jgi:hypothetical protein
MPKDPPDVHDTNHSKPKVDLVDAMSEQPGRVKLVYGLETSRQFVRDQAGIVNYDNSRPHPFSLKLIGQNPGERVEAETRGPTTADVLNNQAFRTFRTSDVRQYSLFNPEARMLYPTPLTQIEALREHRQSSTKDHTPQDQQTFAHYQEGLLRTKYSPVVTLGRDIESMAKKENMSSPGSDPKIEGQVMFRHQTALACKYGLAFGQQNGKILFELGSQSQGDPNYFDPHRAPEKRADDGRGSQSTGGTLRSITNVELRKAFRTDQGEDHLSFFSGGQKTQAPWDSNQDWRWSKYAWDRVEKHTSQGHLTPEQGEALKKKLETAVVGGTLGRETLREVNSEINQSLPKKPTPMPSSPYPLLDEAYKALKIVERDHPLPGIHTTEDRTRVAAALAAQMQKHGITESGGMVLQEKTNTLMLWDTSKNPDVMKRFDLKIDEALKTPIQDSLKTLDQAPRPNNPELQPVVMRAKL